MRSTKRYMSLPYNPALKPTARALRRAGNLSEVLLWNQIKNKQCLGLDFDRQKIIGNYIVDFYCAEKGVVIEVDGSSHDHKVDYDAQRDAFLSGLGLLVIHITDTEVKRNLSGVMEFLRQHPALTTTPPLRGAPPEEGNVGRNTPPLRGAPPEEGRTTPPLRGAPPEEGRTTPPLRGAPPEEGRTTPPLRATPPEEGNVGRNTPPLRATPPEEGNEDGNAQPSPEEGKAIKDIP